MTGTFFDTIVVCSITGLVIASSGQLGALDANGDIITGVALTISAFRSALGSMGGIIVTVGLALFAFSTILGWEYYGEKSLGYLYDKAVSIFTESSSRLSSISALRRPCSWSGTFPIR